MHFIASITIGNDEDIIMKSTLRKIKEEQYVVK